MSASDAPQPVGIVLASHGSLARALLSSAEMIVGAQEYVETVCLEADANLESFHAELVEAIDRADAGAGVILLIDLFGGTPGNAAALCLSQRQLPIVSGVNLPMLLEVMLSRETMTPDELASHAFASGAKGIVDITKKMQEQIAQSE